MAKLDSLKSINPFCPRNSSILKYDWALGKVYSLGSNASLIEGQRVAEMAIKTISQEQFPCIGAKGVLSTQGELMIGSYSDMRDPDVAHAICHDLLVFAEEANLTAMTETDKMQYTSYFTSFGNNFLSEAEAIESVLILIKNIIDCNRKYGGKLPVGYSDEVESPDFALCVASQPFFMAFMHSFHSGDSPRFVESGCYINFNSHHGLSLLKKLGLYNKWKSIIRRRLIDNFGSVHPDLLEHGTVSEIFQYPLASLEGRDVSQKVLRDLFDLSSNSELMLSLVDFREKALNATRCPYSKIKN